MPDIGLMDVDLRIEKMRDRTTEQGFAIGLGMRLKEFWQRGHDAYRDDDGRAVSEVGFRLLECPGQKLSAAS